MWKVNGIHLMDTGVAIFNYADVVKKAVDKYDKDAAKSFADGISGQMDRNLEITKWINKALFGNPARPSNASNAAKPAPALPKPKSPQQPATSPIKIINEITEFDGEKMLDTVRIDVDDKGAINDIERELGNEKFKIEVNNDGDKLIVVMVTRTPGSNIHVSIFGVNNKNNDGSNKFDFDHIKEFEKKINEVIGLGNGETVVVDGYGDSVLKITKTIKDGYPFLEFSAEKKPEINIGNGLLSSENGKIALTKDEADSIKKEIEGFKNPFRRGPNVKFVNDLLNLVNNEFGISGEMTIPKEIVDSIKALTNDMKDIIINKFNDRGKMKNFLEKLLYTKNPISCIITI